MADSTIDTIEGRCPTCDAKLPGQAVLCGACGYDLEKAAHRPAASLRTTNAPVDSSNPFHSPAAIPREPTRRHTFLSLFWINGRIPRSHWWAYQIGYFVVAIGLGGLLENGLIPEWVVVAAVWLMLWVLFVAQVKRWHDMDKSGFWCLINLIPILGSLYALIALGFLRGTRGENDYGEDPLAPRYPPNEY